MEQAASPSAPASAALPAAAAPAGSSASLSAAPGSAAVPAADDSALVSRILDVFAQEARVDRALLTLDTRADALGIASLDFTLALFELEDQFGIQLPDPTGMGDSGGALTVGDLVQQVLQCLAQRSANNDIHAAQVGADTAAQATPPELQQQPAALQPCSGAAA